MVADIRKYTFVVYHHDYDELLRKLRDAGIVHIVIKKEFSECRDLNEDMAMLKRYKEVIRQISLAAPGTIPTEPMGDPVEILSHLEDKLNEIDEAQQRLEVLQPEAQKISEP